MAAVPVLVTLSALLALVHGFSFMSIGDWGGAALDDYHTTDQYVVARGLARIAEQLDAKFVIGTGDNYYYYGVHNTTDPQFYIDFERVYNQSSLMVPWYNVLGNHDYGYNVDAQLQYHSPNNDRWVLPSRYYMRRIAVTDSQCITFVFLDSNPCISDYRNDDPKNWDPCGSEFPFPADCRFHQNILEQNCEDQLTWLKQTVASIPDGDWKIAVAHHPADEIDVEDFASVLQQANFDLYLNGHTHSLSFYQLDGKGAYVLTGAGAMVRTPDQDMPAKKNLTASAHTPTTIWAQTIAGFTYHTFSEDVQSLTTTYADYDGNTLFSFVSVKGQGPNVPKTGSCKEYGCGSFDKSHECQCNSECAYYKDCCSDYKTYCS